MQGKNPFCISFGKQPPNYIGRNVEKQRVLDTFREEPVTDQLFLITGVRGCGKTVFMNGVAAELEKNTDWIVLRESATADISRAVLADLAEKLKLKRHRPIKQAAVTIAGSGVNLEFEADTTPENVISRVDEALRQAADKGKKVLVVVDEVSNTPQMKDFSHLFQIEISQGRPLYFLGTGLYENVQELSDEKDLTFLHRAPRIELSPLNSGAIVESYRRIFSLSETKAQQMAKLTLGYSYAFQVLGYLYWEAGAPQDVAVVLPDYDAMLADASYRKIWMECSETDQRILNAMARIDSDRVAEIRKACGEMPPNYFSNYRQRLMKRGILTSSSHGTLQFALPRFREFVLNQLW